MPSNPYPKIILNGTGSCLPKHSVKNSELLQRVSGFDHEAARASFIKRMTAEDKQDYNALSTEVIFDLWVQQVCGIKERPFISEGEFEDGLACEHMGCIAAERALADAGMDKNIIEHVIFSTYSSNRAMPAPAATVVKMLNLKQGAGGVSAVTLNGACSGFLDALSDASSKLRSGDYKHILVIAAENMSDKMDFTDPTSCIIFSDGAGACVLSRLDENETPSSSPNREILSSASAIDYSEQINMMRTGPIYFNKGPLVQRNAVLAMYNIGKQALERSNLTFDDIHYVIPHQANLRILTALEKKIGVASHRSVLNTIDFTGNLSSATIPVALDFLLHGKLKNVPYQPRTKALFTSVGGGYTYSAVTAQL